MLHGLFNLSQNSRRVACHDCVGRDVLRDHAACAHQGVLPLIFPLLCAVGAALLLTHSHGTTNVREETLAELSHTPLAVAGVVAGWSRWLELRLPTEDRAIPSWIWPLCFVIIGAGLLNYREL